MPANLEFGFPWVIWLLPLPLLIHFLIPGMRTRSASVRFPLFEQAAEITGQKPRKSALVRKRHFLRWVVLFVGWAGILLTLSSPRIVGEPEMQVKTSRNFLITADISFSMAQEDWAVDWEKSRRWDAVKQVMHSFIEKREGDQMGLVFFGSSAYIQCPFTPDLGTVEQLLEEADVGMAGQMTHIGKAIAKGIELFDRDTIETKVMLLLTDGVDAGTDILPLDAARQAQSDSVIIYTIGIGDPSTTGADLDEKTLQEIADMTGGKYYLAKDEVELQEIYAELDRLEPIEYEEKKNRPVTLLYYYPLGATIAWMLLVTFFIQVMDMVRKVRGKEVRYG